MEVGSCPRLSHNALQIMKERYLLRDESGRIAETPRHLFERVAKSVAKAELLYDENADVENVCNAYLDLMCKMWFLPNSPTLMNAGTSLGQLSACFVLPIPDSMKGIFRAIEYMSLIQQSGGGTGFSFSRLRPRGDLTRTTMGNSSGPVSFMRVFDVATGVIKLGGRQRGANMGILSVNHPDILEFIAAKSDGVSFSNFNISVAITDEFMKRFEKNQEYPLINPRTKKVVKRVSASKVFRRIAQCAWKTGDPGIIFIDNINRANPTPQIGEIESTNPCGEEPLLPYESCNLGSIDISKFVLNGEIAWDELKRVIHLAVDFLDNVIDVNRYPVQEISVMTKGNRKIGLGLMGFADFLCKLSIPYDSEEAVKQAETVMKLLSTEARKESEEIARVKGSFPNFKGSVWDARGYKYMRNATLTTIAPTGTISIIAGCSSGIEPLFAVAFIRRVLNRAELLEVNSVFMSLAKERRLLSSKLLQKISEKGSIQTINEIPSDIRRVFMTAHDIAPEWHIKIQATFQKHCDNAVSKTVNLPCNATVNDVKNIFTLAYDLGCKGVTVYRYGSKKDQVLQFASDFSGGCPKVCAY